MDPKTRIQGLRNSALEMAEQHGQYLESWELARAQAAALGEALYSVSGLEPLVPLEQWDWTSTSIPSRLAQACDNILSLMLQPQQGGDAEAREAIAAVRNILISASDFKPGMSSPGRLTELVKGFIPRDTSKDVRKNYRCVDATVGASVWTPAEEPNPLSLSIKTIGPDEPIEIRSTFMCESHEQYEAILEQFSEGGDSTPKQVHEIDARMEVVNVDDLPDIGLRLRVTICGDQVATAEASDEFLERSSLEFGFDKDHVQEELASALLDHMRGVGKRVTVLSWDDAYGNGLMRGRILIQKNSNLMANFAYYDFSDGSTGPESIPEYIRNCFRNTFHESLLRSMSKEKFESHEMSPEDVERRLVAMREHYGFSDEEVVASAIAGTIPPDPDYCEWLVLLGRSDLIRT